MGYILLTNVTFSSTPTGSQTVRIEYRLSSSTGIFTLVTNSAPVLSNGLLDPEVQINGLTDGETYTVKITNLCDGTSTTQTFTTGQHCTSYTLEADVGGATIEWYNCITNSYTTHFIPQNTEYIFCARTSDSYTVLFGSATLVTSTTIGGGCPELP